MGNHHHDSSHHAEAPHHTEHQSYGGHGSHHDDDDDDDGSAAADLVCTIFRAVFELAFSRRADASRDDDAPPADPGNALLWIAGVMVVAMIALMLSWC
jgi:hypothetical protein